MITFIDSRCEMRFVHFLSLVLLALFSLPSPLSAANKYDNPDTIFVARDGTGEFRTVNEAVEVCRAFMEYHKVIFVKKGVYKEKVIIPSWLLSPTTTTPTSIKWVPSVPIR